MLEFAQTFALENNIQMFSGVVVGEDEETMRVLVQDPHGTLSNFDLSENLQDDLFGKMRVGNA